MKKIVLVSIIVVVSIMTVLFFRGRLNMGMLSRSSNGSNGGADLVIVNDSKGDISSSYKENGKEVDTELKAGDQVTGGKGFIRIYTAKKSGSYELTYQYPRPAGSAQKISLSQIIEAAQNENIGDELYIKKGMIGDIKVEYEEVRQLSSTY